MQWRYVTAFLLAQAAGLLAQGTPQIRTQWVGNPPALNVSVTDLPPNAPVEVQVHDITNNQTERPAGNPPQKADRQGNWPGEKQGGAAGYPDTARDPGGTRYVVCVKVNGKTGPCVGTTKPRTQREWWQYLLSLGVLWLTDATGLTAPEGRAGWAVPAAAVLV